MPDRGRGFGETATSFQHHQVREVQASVAKTHFSQLLDEVERGATIVVLRHGRRVARIVPDPERRLRDHRAALGDLAKLGQQVRKRNGPVTAEDIVSSIHEGHKY